MCGRTACTVREGGTGEVDAQARWTTCTRRETAGIEPIRRTGHTEPVPYFTTLLEKFPTILAARWIRNLHAIRLPPSRS